MKQEAKQGIVIFLKAHAGSKSECDLPYLYSGRDAPLVSLYMENDNPFENTGLSQYDGVRVEVSGTAGRNNDFIVTQINVIQ